MLNKRILITFFLFILYIGQIVMFAHLYKEEWENDHQSFIISSNYRVNASGAVTHLEDLLSGRDTEDEFSNHRKLFEVFSLINRSNSVYYKIYTEIFPKKGPFKAQEIIEQENLISVMKRRFKMDNRLTQLDLLSLALIIKESFFLNNLYNKFYTSKEYAPKLSPFKKEFEDIKQYLVKAKTIASSLREKEQQVTKHMTLNDFFYFSVIAGTTTGFGDISPNNEKVRTLVIREVMLSMLLAGLMISSLFASFQRPKRFS